MTTEKLRFETVEEQHDSQFAARRKDQKRLEHNNAARERNAAIRELCGTSAAAARRDGSI